METDHANSRIRARPFAKALQASAKHNAANIGRPSHSHIPGPVRIPCGLPPEWSQDAFQIVCIAVAATARSSAPNAITFARLQLRNRRGKKSAMQDTRESTAVRTKLPGRCTSPLSQAPSPRPQCGSLTGSYCTVTVAVVASRAERQLARRAAVENRDFARGTELPAEILRISAQSPSADVLRYAAERLLHGEVIAIPTDTVYGLAADPFNLSAVEEIFRVKGRPDERALPILVNSLDQAMLLAREVPRNFLRLAEEFWPGALTLVVDASHRLPLKVTANTGRIALRWPRSEVVARLIEEFDGPLTGTSANLSGSEACSDAQQVFGQLGNRLNLILDAGETKATAASTIVELHHDKWKILRLGVIGVKEIEDALQ
jgi:L-threonylcarbamoyladenylate synthase